MSAMLIALMTKKEKLRCKTAFSNAVLHLFEHLFFILMHQRCIRMKMHSKIKKYIDKCIF